MTTRRQQRVLGLIAGIFVLLALAYSLGPIFEGPDEIEHYRYLRVLAETGTFPNAYAYPEGEMHQAPLYYLLLAPLVATQGDADFAAIDGNRNPYHGYEIGIPGSDNRNFYLHTRAEAFPYSASPTARTVHVLRLVSVAVGLAILLTCMAIFRRLWPEQPALCVLAAGFVAFLPQFAYSMAVLSNDVLLYLMTALSLLLLLRLVQDGPSWRLAVLLGLVLGGALLSEISAAVLVFPVGLAVLTDRRTWPYAVVTLLVTLAVAGWWLVRDMLLYNDLTGISAIFTTWDDAVDATGLLDKIQIGLAQAGYAYRGFWARFGYGAVTVGRPLYSFYDALTVITLAGAGWRTVRLLRNRPRFADLRAGLVMAVFGLAWLAALVYWSATVWTGNQGRLLLTSAAVWGALFAYGIGAWLPSGRILWRVALTLPVLLLAAGVIALFGYFFPAYRVLPATPPAAPLAYTYDGLAELVGITPADPHARPGEVITVALHWRALAPADRSLQVYLHTTGDAHVIRRDSLPATGNLLATDWLRGQTWTERYVIRIPEDASPQTVYPLVAGLYDPAQAAVLPARNPAGEIVTPVAGRFAVNGPVEETTPVYCLGDAIGLADVAVQPKGEALEVCTTWIARAAPPEDYQFFIHVLGPEGQPITQQDGPPLSGQYPTGVWQPGERVADCVTVPVDSLPAGWHVALGMYSLPDVIRLPARVCDGPRLPDDRLLVRP